MSSDSNMSEVPVHQDAPPAQADYIYEGGSPDGGQQPAPGMGQSKSSRRRRRKRKNKVMGPGQPAPQGGANAGQDGQSIPEVQAAAAPAPPPQQPQQQYSNGGQQQQSGKRWKKKFRDRQRQALPPGVDPNNAFQPGNTASGFSNYGNGGGGGGFKRKNKQRKDRNFVGPMDHSYRAVNGNFADTPPSTIEVHGNHGNHHGRGSGHGGPRYSGDSQPIDYSQGRPVPIPENAPTKIYFFIEDLFFLAKIQETARKLGVKVAFIKNDKEKDIVSELFEMDEDHRPALIVFDLNNVNAKPLTLIPKLKAKLKRGTSIIGFLQHVQGELKAKAIEAGCDTVMPRSAFSQNLPNLLRRYSAEEEEEPNFNQ